MNNDKMNSSEFPKKKLSEEEQKAAEERLKRLKENLAEHMNMPIKKNGEDKKIDYSLPLKGRSLTINGEVECTITKYDRIRKIFTAQILSNSLVPALGTTITIKDNVYMVFSANQIQRNFRCKYIGKDSKGEN